MTRSSFRDEGGKPLAGESQRPSKRRVVGGYAILSSRMVLAGIWSMSTCIAVLFWPLAGPEISS